MDWSFSFFITSIMTGVGLAMDAFSVSLANGMNEPNMKKGRMLGIAGVFSLFQFVMPMIGWICVHTVVEYFAAFEIFIPWIALILLCFIGGNMLWEGIKGGDEEEHKAVGFAGLMVQGVATAIDALSVGFTTAEYGFVMALVCCLLIGGVTYLICFAGLAIGKEFGNAVAGKAGILGGLILIAIGLKIFIEGVLC